jgi:tetratricopeptide (TPR) repeat protein
MQKDIVGILLFLLTVFGVVNVSAQSGADGLGTKDTDLQKKITKKITANKSTDKSDATAKPKAECLIEVKLGDPDYYFECGYIYANQDDHDQAIQSYTKAIKLNPRKGSYYFRRGLSYIIKGIYDAAIQDFTTAINLKADDGDSYAFRAEAYYKKSDYDNAIKDSNRAIEIDSNDYRAFTTRGNSFAGKGKYQLAISDLNKAIELSPIADYYKNRAKVYRMIGETTLAEADERKARKLY